MIRTALVVMGAIMLTAVGARAFDGLHNSNMQKKNVALIASVQASISFSPLEKNHICPPDMIMVEHASARWCVDTYEASPSRECPHPIPVSPLHTALNLEFPLCHPVSVPGAVPWRFIDRESASFACQKAGKTLISADVWYLASRNTPRDACHLSAEEIRPTGSSSCVSPAGVYDAVGNVWEWVLESAMEGVFAGRVLPPAGFILETDDYGIAISTTPRRDTHETKARLWMEPKGVFGVLRGGYFKSGADGGVHAFNAATLPTFAGTGVGFRCMRAL